MEMGNQLRPDDRQAALAMRRNSHERVRVGGLLAIIAAIVIMTLLLFGSRIPWSAR